MASIELANKLRCGEDDHLYSLIYDIDLDFKNIHAR